MTDGFVILAEFDILPGDVATFVQHARENGAASVRDEPGCRRFDVLLAETEVESITLYEIYQNRAAFAAHLLTPHFAAFDAATKALMRSRSIRRFDLHESAK
jgi:quinol monooxygenase YgiN